MVYVYVVNALNISRGVMLPRVRYCVLMYICLSHVDHDSSTHHGSYWSSSPFLRVCSHTTYQAEKIRVHHNIFSLRYISAYQRIDATAIGTVYATNFRIMNNFTILLYIWSLYRQHAKNTERQRGGLPAAWAGRKPSCEQQNRLGPT